MCLFIKTNNFTKELVQTLKENNELVDEYIYNKGIHVVEIRPDIDYTAFLEGRYSEIYTPSQLKKCFNHVGDRINKDFVVAVESDQLQILKRNPEYFPKYVEYIRKQFGESIKIESIKAHKEYDMMPNLNQEIMSYE